MNISLPIVNVGHSEINLENLIKQIKQQARTREKPVTSRFVSNEHGEFSGQLKSYIFFKRTLLSWFGVDKISRAGLMDASFHRFRLGKRLRYISGVLYF